MLRYAQHDVLFSSAPPASSPAISVRIAGQFSRYSMWPWAGSRCKPDHRRRRVGSDQAQPEGHAGWIRGVADDGIDDRRLPRRHETGIQRSRGIVARADERRLALAARRGPHRERDERDDREENGEQREAA